MKRHTPVILLLVLGLLSACDGDAILDTKEQEPPSHPDPEQTAEVFPTIGEVRTGYIMGRDGKPIKVTFEVQGELAIFEGDIVLGPASGIAKSAEELTRRPPGVNFGVYINGERYKWMDPRQGGYGTVFYEIDPALPNKERVINAIALIESSGVPVFFYPRNGEADYLRFVPSTKCTSWVGRQEGRQLVSLADGCGTGTTAHEILHALGMWHEQSRCDRDSFVEVLWGNIKPEFQHNFGRKCDDSSDHVAYAEGSIMHYGTHDFSANGQPTLRSRRGLDYLMGQRSNPSASDVQTVQKIYLGDQPGLIMCKPSRPGGHCSVVGSRIEERIRGIATAVGGIGPYSGVEGTPMTFTAGEPQPDLAYSWYFGEDESGSSATTASYTYADNGTYPVILTITDAEGSTASIRTTATVTNAVPAVSAGTNATINSGQTFNFSGTFADAGVNDTPWAYSIDWGTGTPTAGTTSNQSSAVTGSRQYLAAGTHTVRLSVTDKDGGTGSGTLTLTVRRVPISVDIKPGSSPTVIKLNETGDARIPVALLSTASFDATHVDPATVQLGATAVSARRNGSLFASREDVNGDGRADLVVHFDRALLMENGDLTTSTVSLTTIGSLTSGVQFVGTEAVQVLP